MSGTLKAGPTAIPVFTDSKKTGEQIQLFADFDGQAMMDISIMCPETSHPIYFRLASAVARKKGDPFATVSVHNNTGSLQVVAEEGTSCEPMSPAVYLKDLYNRGLSDPRSLFWIFGLDPDHNSRNEVTAAVTNTREFYHDEPDILNVLDTAAGKIQINETVTGTICLTPLVDTYEIHIDDTPYKGSWKNIPLLPGQHTLSLHYQGHKIGRTSVEAGARERRELAVPIHIENGKKNTDNKELQEGKFRITRLLGLSSLLVLAGLADYMAGWTIALALLGSCIAAAGLILKKTWGFVFWCAIFLVYLKVAFMDIPKINLFTVLLLCIILGMSYGFRHERGRWSW
ncbi:MAG: hypothetical protein LUQ31_11240 [Methanoregula sp.]|nr:hypothetical protein [Methanoregula sp.]